MLAQGRGGGRRGTAGDGRGWLRTAGDCRRRPGMVRDGGGLPATPGDGTSNVL